MLASAIAAAQEVISHGPPYSLDAAVELYLTIACQRPRQVAVAWDHRMAYETARGLALAAKASADPAYPALKAAAQAAKTVFLADERHAELSADFTDELEQLMPGLAEATAETMDVIVQLANAQHFQALVGG
jgi:hypothetical protein